jgi:hypothetical protein
MKRVIFCLFFAMSFSFAVAQKSTVTWEYTYLKALPAQKANLIKFIHQNWFVMDSLAVSQGLMIEYKLLENAQNTADWDFIVAVAYPQKDGYLGIKDAFEKIRSKHKLILVDGKKLNELGNIIKSEKIFELN